MDINAAIMAAIGGAIIGLAASLLLLGLGKVAGISGISARIFTGDDRHWRAAFVVGLVVAGVIANMSFPAQFANTTGIGVTQLIAAGLLVGFGTRLGSGCTSGHGVCGLSRASKRSLTATMAFMLSGGAAVYISQHLLGGGS